LTARSVQFSSFFIASDQIAKVTPITGTVWRRSGVPARGTEGRYWYLSIGTSERAFPVFHYSLKYRLQ